MPRESSYLPAPVQDARSVIAVQLPGLELNRESCFINGIHVVRLPYFDWRLLENSEVAQEFLSDYSHRPRYFCVFAFPFDVDRSHYQMVRWHVDQLFMALWLHKDGTLIDPHYTTTYQRGGGSKAGNIPIGIKANEHGLYGCEFLVQYLRPPYELRADEVPAVASMVQVLLTYRTYRSDPAVDLALGNFRWLHGPSLLPREQLSLLFAALEALFGSFRERYDGATLGTRVEVLLPSIADRRTRNVVDKDLRNVRNALAHGSFASENARIVAAVPLLTTIVRTSLTAAVNFAVAFPDHDDEIRQLVGDRERWSAHEAFNYLLALSSAGRDEARALLQATPRFHDFMAGSFGADTVAAARSDEGATDLT